MPVTNLSFYRFVAVDDPQALAASLYEACARHRLLGKIVVATEGINGMLAGTAGDVADWADWLHEDPRFSDLRLKPSESDDTPFGKLVVRVKPEIVTMRVGRVDAATKTGPRVAPEQFRDWLRGGEPMVVVDVRNDYEFGVGHFRGAIDPQTAYFNQFPAWVAANRSELEAAQRVVTYCTGGIRCEKATAWMLEQGFTNVWQLEGGIHNYFERIVDAHTDWDGELFVFDGRVAVDTRLTETPTTLCTRCGDPVPGGDDRTCGCGR